VQAVLAQIHKSPGTFELLYHNISKRPLFAAQTVSFIA
jgi:hypothetical protein